MPDYPKAVIHTNQGEINIELWNDVAPNHVENFRKLVESGFYDGLHFHRIVPGFVIQGGCPNGDGTGGPGWNVDAEFNDREHHPGTLSMARAADPNSAGSQFFICLTREYCQHLDGNYTAFGQVIEGMDIVNRIAETPIDENTGRPKQPATMDRVEMVT